MNQKLIDVVLKKASKLIGESNCQIVKELFEEEIKRQLLKRMDSKESFFFGITGGPGTGKTLLLYDLALTLSKDHHVIVLHSGYLCEGHRVLAKGCKNLEIIEPKKFLYREIQQVDYVLIDEAHRLWYGPMEKIRKWLQ